MLQLKTKKDAFCMPDLTVSAAGIFQGAGIVTGLQCLDLFGIEPCAFTTICTTLGAMDSENGARKSKRHRQPSTVLEDYVQDRVFHDESFITQDEQPVERSDPEGKYSTYR